MENLRYKIYYADQIKEMADYDNALLFASQKVSELWKCNNDLGACFSMVYDKLNQHRTICWLNNEHYIKYRKLY